MSAEEHNKLNFKKYYQDFKDIVHTSVLMLKYAFSKSPKALSIYMILILISSVLPFLSSWVNSKVIDTLISMLDGNATSQSVLFTFLGVAVGVMFLRQLANGLSRYFEMLQWFDIGRDMSHDITSKISNLDMEFFEQPETLDLINQVRENSQTRPQQFIGSLLVTLDSIVSIVTAVSIIILINPIYIFILFLTTLPRAVINIIFGRRSYGIWAAKGDVRRDYWDSKSHLLNQDSLMEVRIFKLRQYLLQRTYNLFYTFQKEQVTVETKRSAISILGDLLGVFGFGAILLLTALAVLAREITIGNFTFYMATVGNLQMSFTGLFVRVSQMFESGLYVRDIFKVLSFEEKILPGEIHLPKSNVPPTIEFRDVSFAYPGTDRLIFDKLNLTINSKDHVAIVGENGSGKTTLIKLLMRFYDVTGGAILVNGHNIRDLDTESWYEMVGVLFQQFNFYHFDAKTNISVGNIDLINDFERVVDSAQKTGAHEFIDSYAHKYDQVLSRAYKGGITPSIGQKQKIALARAFFKDAPILILDEPTSAIDPKAEFEIFERLFDFANEKTVIIISHRFSTVRNADRIIVLDKGKIIEDGTHEELMQLNTGIYRHAFELQRKGYQ